MKNLEKMLMSKNDKNGKMSEQEIQAKMDVLMELMDMAKQALGSKVKSGMDEMQKVSVMAPDKEGLEEGLDKAQEILESSPHMMEESKEEMLESKEEESSELPKPEEKMMMGKEKRKRKLFSMLDEDEE